MNTRVAGAHYEDLALAHLQRAGLDLIERNAACRHGEIDLIMRDGEVVVFIEVRYRSRSGFGDGLDSVSVTKQAKLVRAARMFLARHPSLARRTCRFDVVALSDDVDSTEWCRNAFEAH